MEYAIELRNITKEFPGIKANDNINLKVRKNEVHSLLGENGSGKSTLMNILFGLYQPDEGDIYINGEKANIKNPEDAHSYGIGMVHQHFMLVEQMTALENIILGNESSGFFLNKSKSYKIVKEMVDKYGFKIDLNEKVSNLSIGMKQRVEILKTLYRGAEIVILDEPSAVLTPQEVIELYGIINSLKEKGKTVIFITHKLNEIMEVADSITVIRRGKVISSLSKCETTPEKLAHEMVGRNVETIVSNENIKLGKTVLKIQNVNLLTKNKDTISLEIKEGEILGIAGVDGNGQLQLEETVIGLKPQVPEKVFFNGVDIGQMSISQRKSMGIGYIPSDRFHRAILPSFSVKENVLLGFHDNEPFVNKGIINNKNLLSKTESLIEEFDVRVPNASVSINKLSGGNQQKVVLARETSQNPSLIIAAQPTRGLDVGAIEFIHRNLLSLKKQGKAILLISAELSEVMNLSDKIAVMFEGKIQGIIERKDFDKERIGRLMAGN